MEVETKDNAGDLLIPSLSCEVAAYVEHAFQILWEATFPVCAMHNIDSHDFVEEHELSHGQCLPEKVGLT